MRPTGNDPTYGELFDEVKRLTLLKDALVGDKNRLKAEVEQLRGRNETGARTLAITDETLEATRLQNNSLWAELARLRCIEEAAREWQRTVDGDDIEAHQRSVEMLEAALADQPTEGRRHDAYAANAYVEALADQPTEERS